MPRFATYLLLILIGAFASSGATAGGGEPTGLDDALSELSRDGEFSGAVVVYGPEGIRFARGYGPADPFEGRAFTPDTPVDSASLAKPITAAAVLFLVSEGKIDLDAPVQGYLPEYPYPSATVRQLLSHSAGLSLSESAENVADKTNAALLAEAQTAFEPGTAFAYCNACSITLALLIERVTGRHYLDVVKSRVALPVGVMLRPRRLADWGGRALGYRRLADGRLERSDSWDGELFYGPGNFSLSAAQLAEWGSEWWKPGLEPIRNMAVQPARIGASQSGLTLGNWYCARDRRGCHYLGHHEGFHHMLYWDADGRVAVAIVTNNSLAPALQQRVQRSLVAFVDGEAANAARELDTPLPETEVPVGSFVLTSGERVDILGPRDRRSVRRSGVEYRAYPIGSAILYVPGLDLYLAGSPDGGLHWLTLYEDLRGTADPHPNCAAS